MLTVIFICFKRFGVSKRVLIFANIYVCNDQYPFEMRKVLFVGEFIPQYRKDFFYLSKKMLLEQDVNLEVIYGNTDKTTALKNEEVEIEWAKQIPNKTFKIYNTNLVWQPCVKELRDKDLVIVENANRMLINYYLMAAHPFSRFKFAFWGHGRNLQVDLHSWRNRFKNLFITKCDWWFAYTNLSKRLLESRNYPARRITVMQNAIDTHTIREHYSRVTEHEISQLKTKLGIQGDMTALYCGALYPEKNLDFILETCYRVKREIPDFHMIFIGSGIESDKVLKASQSNDWIHYVGSRFGKERVKYFRISKVQLMPYALGLGLVDSFALETPIITTSSPYHGPEIDYLENGINGIMTEDNQDDYSTKVIETLKNKSYVELRKGCRVSADKITLESMVTNFKEGILSCLNTEKN